MEASEEALMISERQAVTKDWKSVEKKVLNQFRIWEENNLEEMKHQHLKECLWSQGKPRNL